MLNTGQNMPFLLYARPSSIDHGNSGDIGPSSVVDGIITVTLYVSHLKADPNRQFCDKHEGRLFHSFEAMDLTHLRHAGL